MFAAREPESIREIPTDVVYRDRIIDQKIQQSDSRKVPPKTDTNRTDRS